MVVSQISIMNVGSSTGPHAVNVHHSDGRPNVDLPVSQGSRNSASTSPGSTSGSSSSSSSGSSSSTSPLRMCEWVPGGPVFYNLHTKMGVSYEGGHWFHMAENFMTAHSSLRQAGRLAAINSTDVAGEVYYNFDNPRFVKELNGVTKLIVALGTVGSLVPVGGSLADPYSEVPLNRRIKALHYAYIPPHTRLGDGRVPTVSGQRGSLGDVNDTTTTSGSTSSSHSRSSTLGSGSGRTGVTHPNPSHPTDVGLGVKISDLRPGDTFLLRHEWVQSQQSEVLWPVQVYAKKMFVSGQVAVGAGHRARVVRVEGGEGLRGGGRGRRRRVGVGVGVGGYVNGTQGRVGGGVGVGTGMGGSLSGAVAGAVGGVGSTEALNQRQSKGQGQAAQGQLPTPGAWRPPLPQQPPTPTRLADEVCVRYQGTVGGEWPTPQRGHWFPHTGDVESFRAKLRELCPPNEIEVREAGEGRQREERRVEGGVEMG